MFRRALPTTTRGPPPRTRATTARDTKPLRCRQPPQSQKVGKRESDCHLADGPKPSSPGFGGIWALKTKARHPHPLPPASAGPLTPPGRSLPAQSPDPRWRRPPGPRPSHSHSPSPAAAATSKGRRLRGRVSRPERPSLTSFPVWAGGVGRRRDGRNLAAREAPPQHGASGQQPRPLPSRGTLGATRTRKEGKEARSRWCFGGRRRTGADRTVALRCPSWGRAYPVCLGDVRKLAPREGRGPVLAR